MNAAQADTTCPPRRNARQANANGRPNGARKINASHACGSTNRGIPPAAVTRRIPNGSHSNASRMKEEKRFIRDFQSELSLRLCST